MYLLPTFLLTMFISHAVCQVFEDSKPRTGNVGVAPERKPIGGVSYSAGGRPDDFSTPAPEREQTYQWQYSPDENSIVEASISVGDTPRATGKFEIVSPDNQIRSKVNYVADENGYRANFMLSRI